MMLSSSSSCVRISVRAPVPWVQQSMSHRGIASMASDASLRQKNRTNSTESCASQTGVIPLLRNSCMGLLPMGSRKRSSPGRELQLTRDDTTIFLSRGSTRTTSSVLLTLSRRAYSGTNLERPNDLLHAGEWQSPEAHGLGSPEPLSSIPMKNGKKVLPGKVSVMPLTSVKAAKKSIAEAAEKNRKNLPVSLCRAGLTEQQARERNLRRHGTEVPAHAERVTTLYTRDNFEDMPNLRSEYTSFGDYVLWAFFILRTLCWFFHLAVCSVSKHPVIQSKAYWYRSPFRASLQQAGGSGNHGKQLLFPPALRNRSHKAMRKSSILLCNALWSTAFFAVWVGWTKNPNLRENRWIWCVGEYAALAGMVCSLGSVWILTSSGRFL
ncbi:unnamed protein product [Amoebophrya sp. A25]|nr:unnamed protein product [Amoebophrya sp. A25]|eukprot:GSA25T00000064001.1